MGLGRYILYLHLAGIVGAGRTLPISLQRRGGAGWGLRARGGRISEEMLPLAWVDRFPTHQGLVASILMYASPP
jgi:hypothetical protein